MLRFFSKKEEEQGNTFEIRKEALKTIIAIEDKQGRGTNPNRITAVAAFRKVVEDKTSLFDDILAAAIAQYNAVHDSGAANFGPRGLEGSKFLTFMQTFIDKAIAFRDKHLNTPVTDASHAESVEKVEKKSRSYTNADLHPKPVVVKQKTPDQLAYERELRDRKEIIKSEKRIADAVEYQVGANRIRSSFC